METITTVKHLIPRNKIIEEMIQYHQTQRIKCTTQAQDSRRQREQTHFYSQAGVHSRMVEFWSNVILDEPTVEGTV